MARTAKTDDYDQHKDFGWFRDELRQRDRLVAELRGDLDEANDALRRFDEYVEEYESVLERWRETFHMELTDDGWSWKPFWDEYKDLVARYQDLVKRWNRMVTIFNANARDVGRPLAASEAQVAAVLKWHKQGKSLRWIADETSLGLQTVRTIIGRQHGTDRTTKKRHEKIEIDKFQRASWKSQQRTGDALPKQVQAVIEAGKALVVEAKGLGRGR